VTLTGLQQAAVDAIKAAIPTLAQCEIYGGQFSGQPGSRVAIHAPAVLITILGCKPVSDPGIEGQMDMQCRFAAYVLAQNNRSRDQREGACIDLVESVSLLIHNNNFGLPMVGLAALVQMQGMTNASADDAGFSLWSVTWDQDIRIGAAPVNNYGPITDVRIGVAPDIGIGNEPYYTALMRIVNEMNFKAGLDMAATSESVAIARADMKAS